MQINITQVVVIAASGGLGWLMSIGPAQLLRLGKVGKTVLAVVLALVAWVGLRFVADACFGA